MVLLSTLVHRVGTRCVRCAAPTTPPIYTLSLHDALPIYSQKAGIEIGEKGGVRCSSRLESSVPGIFAAGDICEYDSPVHGGKPVRIEHWDVAFNHGKTAALNLLGKDVPHDVVPYFFSDLGDWGGLEYVGPAYGWDEEVLRGSHAGGAF